MAARRIEVIGGGPGGLFAARLLALAHPDWELVVHERLEPDDTFGFGVGLTPALLRTVDAADHAVHDDLVAASATFSSAVFDLPNGISELPNSHAGAIGRAHMLRLLLERARDAGVDVRIGSSPTADDLRADADLVIAADGVSSATRAQLAAELGATEEVGRGLFMWVGAALDLPGTVFKPVTTPHGTFVVHAYPYADGLASVYVEADAATIEKAGCRNDEFADDGASDEDSLRYLSGAFAGWLGGGDFIGNRSRWSSFRTVRCARWRHENVLVLGDAAATAHPSLGSGTKLALEAAVALAASMRDIGNADVISRLDDFDAALRPSVEHVQERARRSQLWWESFPLRLGLSPARVAAAYMSRAGAVSLEQLHAVSPGLADQAVADFAGVALGELPADDLQEWILGRPLAVNGHVLPGRILASGDDAGVREIEVDCDDPWGSGAQAMIDGLPPGPAEVIRLSGKSSREALLDRLALGERIRAELGAVVAVRSDAELLGDAIDGLVAGRADLVTIGAA